jgi:transcription-repair coupling factor (superfamily II helicase)
LIHLRFFDEEMNSALHNLSFNWKAVDRALEKLKTDESISIDFSPGSTERSLFLAKCFTQLQRKILYVVPDNSHLDDLEGELRTCLNCFGQIGAPVVSLKKLSSTPHDSLSIHSHILAKRAQAVEFLFNSQPGIAVVPVSALLWGLPEKSKYFESRLEIDKSTAVEIDELSSKLVTIGYQKRQLVQGPGDFAIRGFVVDIFSPNHGFPLRVELFGDSIENMRLFNTEDQKSLSEIDSYTIVPMRALLSDDDFDARLRGYVISSEKLDSESKAERLSQITKEEDAPWYWNVKDSENYIRLVGSHFDNKDVCAIINETSLCEKDLLLDLQQWENKRLESGWVKAGWVKKVTDFSRLYDFLGGNINSIELNSFQQTAETHISAGVEVFSHIEDPGDANTSIISKIGKRAESKALTVAFLATRGHAQRLTDRLDELQTRTLTIDISDSGQNSTTELESLANTGSVIVLIGTVSNSFYHIESNILFLSQESVFGSRSKAKPSSSLSKAFSLPVEELKPGDFIVHEDHGIGVYKGLQKITRSEEVQEFIQLEYSAGDRLLIPVDKMVRVQRYSSIEGMKPRLDRLGGTTWQKIKKRVTKALREMAGELINLYAVRKTIKGISYLPDNQLMREFEESFPHVETEDQRRALEEIKADMESEKPMDRLLCGDVGFGKTELALRAAVKAAISGKQTAVLAPTTILAQQHFETFNERFKGFPFKVDVLSRFRNRSQQKETLEKLKAGKINVITGTHRILSKDVLFKDLGLLIVDEEQRFGVAHKEKLKKLRKRIDVLSLTATPIPRTLNMSIAGIREMSIIQTPPHNRMAVSTRVLPFREEIIQSAVEQELQRDGQVFYLRNRVDGIEESAARISRLVKDAKPVVAHAQMTPQKLETVMRQFIDGTYNVLVSTTIIENGIDIPNANTLIVERAERFGLSQLYQIRGRVGRSNRNAYAYLLVPGEAQLTEEARRRLHAIREFSDLGSGFRIAAMDLEIRGAGTLLGGEQSGHIEAVGFDLYNRMLERTVKEMQGETVQEDFETQLNLEIDTHIPSQYIQEASQRIKYYRSLMEASSGKEIEEVQDQIIDLYGPMPESVQMLITFARIKRKCSTLKIASIDRKAETISIQFTAQSEINMQNLAEILQHDEASFSENGTLFIKMPDKNKKEMMFELESNLQALQ